MTTFIHLCRYINQQFTLPVTGIKLYHRLQEDLRLNDLEVLEVIAFMEVLYGLTLPDEALLPSLSVAQLCMLIEQHTKKEQLDPAFLVYRNSRHIVSKAS